MKQESTEQAPESATELGAAGSRGGSWPDLHRHSPAPVGMVFGAYL